MPSKNAHSVHKEMLNVKSLGPVVRHLPFEQLIHQQESNGLQGSGSPYTMSHTTIRVPLYLFTLVNFFRPHSVSMHNSPLLSSAYSLPSPSPSLCLLASVLLFPQAPSLFPFLPPTGWAVKQEHAHGRPLTTRNAAIELYCRAYNCRFFTQPSLVDQHCAPNGPSGLAAIH